MLYLKLSQWCSATSFSPLHLEHGQSLQVTEYVACCDCGPFIANRTEGSYYQSSDEEMTDVPSTKAHEGHPRSCSKSMSQKAASDKEPERQRFDMLWHALTVEAWHDVAVHPIQGGWFSSPLPMDWFKRKSAGNLRVLYPGFLRIFPSANSDKTGKYHPQMIHVWNIYLHDWAIFWVNVGKYSIAFGI